MKTKFTKKEINSRFNTVIRVGYCDIQYLTKYIDAFGYSTRSEGWACDYFEVENICISTGYAPIGQNIDYKLLRKYELKAEKIALNHQLSFEVRAKRVNKLLKEFVNKSINN